MIGLGLCCCGELCLPPPNDPGPLTSYSVTLSGITNRAGSVCAEGFCDQYNGVWDGSDPARPALLYTGTANNFYLFSSSSTSLSACIPGNEVVATLWISIDGLPLEGISLEAECPNPINLLQFRFAIADRVVFRCAEGTNFFQRCYTQYGNVISPSCDFENAEIIDVHQLT